MNITATTVTITHTQQRYIRCVARVDMPEYGITVGEVFYCSRSSKNNGEYYITRFDVSLHTWLCSCAAVWHCKHIKGVSAACKARAKSRNEREAACTFAVHHPSMGAVMTTRELVIAHMLNGKLDMKIVTPATMSRERRNVNILYEYKEVVPALNTLVA